MTPSVRPMGLTRFEQLARDKARTRDELEKMKANALAVGHIECAGIAEEVLRERFPVRPRVQSDSMTHARTPARSCYGLLRWRRAAPCFFISRQTVGTALRSFERRS